jgi:hypothetical protein
LQKLLAVLLLLALGTIARADLMRIELIGGTIATRADGDVVLDLSIAPLRLDWIANAHAATPVTWGDVRRREPFVRARLLAGLALHESAGDVPPDDVQIVGLGTSAETAPLPDFLTVEVTWHHAGLLHAAFAANDVVAKFPPGSLTQIQLMLQENMPWWQVLSRSMLLGIEHIVPFGLDHILFVLGIYLAASRFRDLLWQVTAFTVAHSITLGLTMSGVIIVGPFWEQFVELIVILAAAALTAWWWKRSWYQPNVAVPISLLIGLYGMFAALDRITNLQFPRREFGNAFWQVYDRDFWCIPFLIGTLTLGLVWALYRTAVSFHHLRILNLLKMQAPKGK